MLPRLAHISACCCCTPFAYAMKSTVREPAIEEVEWCVLSLFFLSQKYNFKNPKKIKNKKSNKKTTRRRSRTRRRDADGPNR